MTRGRLFLKTVPHLRSNTACCNACEMTPHVDGPRAAFATANHRVIPCALRHVNAAAQTRDRV